jgi:hypothetical protein
MPSLFLTYAWVDNADEDFDFIVQELQRSGVKVHFDRVALVPGRHLWDQIGKRITEDPIDGWGFFVTPASLQSRACREEYFLALGRALDSRGPEFPLIALVKGPAFKDLPPSLAIRLAISLDDPDWKEQVLAGLERRAPRIAPSDLAPVALRWHPSTAPNHDGWLEVRPRLATVGNWRIGVPLEMRGSVVGHMEGASGNPPAGGILVTRVECESTDKKLWLVGARGPVGSGLSAFVALRRPFPSRIIFGSEGSSGYSLDVPPA